MLTATGGFKTKDGSSKPWLVTAVTAFIAATNLVDLAGEEYPAMWVNFKRYRSSKKGKWWIQIWRLECVSKCGGEISRAVTEFVSSILCRFTRARAIFLGGSEGTSCCRFLRRYEGGSLEMVYSIVPPKPGPEVH
jgi:hypothetical protein